MKYIPFLYFLYTWINAVNMCCVNISKFSSEVFQAKHYLPKLLDHPCCPVRFGNMNVIVRNRSLYYRKSK